VPAEDTTTESHLLRVVPEDAVPRSRTPQMEVDRSEDAVLVARLRAGDESAFVQVVDAWSPMMLRVARTFVSTDASAQEIVQEAWLGVVRGLDRFEGRSSMRTWVFRILTNIGKTRGVREARTVPLSALSPDSTTPTVDPSRFRGPDDEWSNGWTPVGSPQPWSPSPEDEALAGEIRGQVATALQELPERQRTVVSLRDVHGMSADEVCDALDISAANQRVLLHRGRARLRETLEDYYRGLTPVMSS
jgi:RNA polymerase sigma-70 factor (ECF subfamily)